MLHTKILRPCSHHLLTVGSYKHYLNLWQIRVVNAHLLLYLLDLLNNTKAIYFWHLYVSENESVTNVATSLSNASIVHINSNLST